MKRHYSLYYNDLYPIRSGIQVSLMWYIVADRFTRTEITYIQVTLPPYLKLRDVVINNQRLVCAYILVTCWYLYTPSLIYSRGLV